MLALQILSLKTFMNHLLAGDTFDMENYDNALKN